MKIEILKSAKGNEQKQNKPAKPPNPKSQSPKPQAVPHAKKRQSKGKSTLRLGYTPRKTENSPRLL